jgi:4-hydroxybenzoate polyprenyltransferase/phosphoserine phosphatase
MATNKSKIFGIGLSKTGATSLATQSSDVPLFVDLDGTLVKTDMLMESFFGLLKRNPWRALLSPFWLLRGKAYFKHRVAEHVDIDPAVLPYHSGFLEFLRHQSKQGRRLYLATACDQKLAKRVADHLGIFYMVLASDGITNLSGSRKLEAMTELCGDRGFDYAGNGAVDLSVWSHARRAILVNAPSQVEKSVKRTTQVEQTFVERGRGFDSYLRAMRVHQWLKNLLLFVPLAAAHAWQMGFAPFLHAGLGFLAFSLSASSLYILNDLLDLPMDRVHPRKRTRPFAAGDLPITSGIALMVILLLSGLLIAVVVSPVLLMVLLAYVTLTLFYSLHLKVIALVDVLVLAGLYTLRVIAGAAAIRVVPSFWLLAFSMFIFLSLALVKRCSELQTMLSMNRASVSGRDYHLPDLNYLYSMGIASGYLAVLVLALFVNSPDVAVRYSHPQLLWLLCPSVLYWISRLWLKTGRGEMHDDPLIYSVTDRGSRFIAAASLIVMLLAI